MRLGLALSGGGARGIAHIGVIKALEELGLRFSCVSGTSAGSIVGSMYAYGYSPDQIMEIVLAEKLYRSFRPSWTLTGLLSMDGLKTILLKHMPENDFSALKIPMTVVATDLRLAVPKYFTEGELIAPITASCTVPGVFSPVTFNGGLYIDGGILDNLPVQAIRSLSDFIVGSNCNHLPPDFDAKNVKLVLERTVLVAIETSVQESKRLCDVLIDPPGLARYSGYDIGKAKEIFDFAYRFTKENFTSTDFSAERKKTHVH